MACCQLIPFHKLSFCSHPTNLWFRSIDLWPLPLSYLTCPNQQIYNKIYQDKIVCTAAITSCGNGSAWALALSLLDEMPRQLAMPDVSSCQASALDFKSPGSRLIECNWNTLGSIEEWIFPKNIPNKMQNMDIPPQNLEVWFRVVSSATLGDVWFGSTCQFCKGVVRVALMVATGDHQYPCPRHPILFSVNGWGLFIHWRVQNLH